jgi:hypothetical protein
MYYPFFALLFACSLYALAAGGTPERIGAAAYALACIASHLVYSAPPIKFRSVEVGVLIVDIIVFVAFIFLALRAHRFWPIWVSGLLGLGVLAHVARWAGSGTMPWAYQMVMTIWSYPILALIVLGTFNHQRRLKRSGSDPSWSRSSGPSPPTASKMPTP